MYFVYPYKEVWTTAQRVSEDLCETFIALTYGAQTKFYNKIILAKARFVVKEWSWRNETIDRTKDVTEFIRKAPTLKELIAFKKFKKSLVSATLSLAARKNTALDKSVASRRGKDKTIIAGATTNLNEINEMTGNEKEMSNNASLISAINNRISPTATKQINITNTYNKNKNKNTATPRRQQQQHQNRTDTASTDSHTATEQRNKRKNATVTYDNNNRHRYEQDNRYRKNNSHDNYNYHDDDRYRPRDNSHERGGRGRGRGRPKDNHRQNNLGRSHDDDNNDKDNGNNKRRKKY